jgi:class 3 adenylate cyclase/HAMP domain-containing protein
LNVRLKIILIVLPLLIFSLAVAGLSSALAARNGLTAIAVEFLGFKAEELELYSNNQWGLLVNNHLTERADLVGITRQSIATHAIQMTRSRTELTMALEDDGSKAFANRPLDLGTISEAEAKALKVLVASKAKGWTSVTLGGRELVGFGFYLEAFHWMVLVTEEASAFYAPVNQIVVQTAMVLVITVILSVLFLIVFSGILTRPLGQVVKAMDRIIASGEMNEKVEVRFHDEIGHLAHTFNSMMVQLDSAYRQVKTYALDAVIAKRNEQKIRQIFQKYVPTAVINQIFANPEKMLVGDVREIAILFTDIRSFTTISEAYRPDELVTILNFYFSILVEIIMEKHGVVDKYIGDAVMAFFGAPARFENDAEDALRAGLAIADALEKFNGEQKAAGKQQFLTGIGINYGAVTVGNIGTEKKMDYTVIGDNVNLASRLEGLTKEYHQAILISESLTKMVGPAFPYRLVDTVIVKGKTEGVRIYTSSLTLTEATKAAWQVHNAATDLFYARKFREARVEFEKVAKLLPGDYLAELFLQRCHDFEAAPPPANWNGTIQMTHK